MFQLCAFSLGAFFAYGAAAGAAGLSVGGKFRPPPQRLRLTVTGLSNSSESVANANPFFLGLLQAGCPLALVNTGLENIPGNGSSPAIMESSDPLIADGYFILIPSGPSGRVPVRWLLEASPISSCSGNTHCSSHEWLSVSASVSSGSGVVYPDLSYPVPQSDGPSTRIDIDLRPSWPACLLYAKGSIIPACGWLMAGLSGLFRRSARVNAILGGMFATNVLVEGAGAIGFSSMGNAAWRSVLDGWLFCLPDALLSTCLLCAERYTLYAFGVYGILLTIILVSACFQYAFSQ